MVSSIFTLEFTIVILYDSYSIIVYGIPTFTPKLTRFYYVESKGQSKNSFEAALFPLSYKTIVNRSNEYKLDVNE